MTAYNFIQKNVWLLASALYGLLIISFANTPVFWDMYAQVKTAHYFLETSFHQLLPNGNGFTDNGYFPLYAIYLAGIFKVFGFHLWVAHISVFPFVVGLFYHLQQLCKRFLSSQKTGLVLLLALLNPMLITQSIYFSSEICIALFCCWLLNALLDNRASHIVIASSLLCLLNLRMLPFIILLWTYFLFFKKEKNAWYLLFSILIALTWLLTHFYLFGWVLQNPQNIEHRSFSGFLTMLKTIFWLCIRFIDYGGIVAIVFILKNSFQKKKTSEPFLFVLLFSVSVFMFSIPLSNPINTRYFLPIYILMLPAFVLSLDGFSVKRTSASLGLFLIFMWQTQLIKTPKKYGYSWDCNLQSLSYFDVRKQLDEYVSQNNISPKEIDAGYQLYFNDDFYLMNNSHKEYSLLSDTEMPTNTFVAQSNIPNNYNPKREEYLKKNYTLVKSFTAGWAYVDLYQKQ